MTTKVTTLQELAQLASDENGGKRGRALQTEADRRGLRLSYTTVDKILNGKYTSTPRRETIEALATLAGVPAEVAFAAAGVPTPTRPVVDELPPDIDIISDDQRHVLVSLARVFVKQTKELHELRNHADHSPTTDNGHRAPAATVADPPAAGTPRETEPQDQKTPTRDELAHLRRRQEEADNTPIEKILGYAADRERPLDGQ
ncbi:hypothetical protein NQ036_06945 [Brevibacterium sp. 91QC2O2]|uniref:hypothetical protein n=1 Tax=Brevibacterium sp. 91QC2O2 TaxID=2968458 RepID=UPI00211C74C9|nr:hypothetical protein [Brevibacterium sp. 91QC2O2]MCQ9367981.1 hypothetical protein [Brevibacterium sp. 91QC2O2]